MNKLDRFYNDYRLRKLLKHFKNRRGLEIGGPSAIFKEVIPIYKQLKALDGCNFSLYTIWEGDLIEGNNYTYEVGKKGYQYIAEASDLKAIPNQKYDLVLSSHCLEHCANPLKTIREWLRVVRTGGYLILVLPDKRFTFDHRRPITRFDHLLEDLKKNVDEDDMTHLSEILHLHDLSLDLPAGNISEFTRRSKANLANRCLHHHVFDFPLIIQMCRYFKLRIKFKKFISPFHQVVIAKKI